MKFVIAGLGSIGRRHLKNLLSLGERDIVLYRNRKSTLPDSELAGFPVVTELKEALDLRPDAVIISNPTSLHLDVAIPAAEAGCAILLEKPVSHSFDRIDELRSAVQRGKAGVLVGFQFRFHPSLKAAAAIIGEGQIGRVVSAFAHWGEYLPGWHPWEDYSKSYAARPDLGGGVVLTLCHPLDYLAWLLGKPELLWAHTATVGDLAVAVEDTADLFLRFPGGAAGSIHLDYIRKPASHWFEITGTRGILRWENNTGILSLFRHDRGDWEHIDPPQGFERNWLFAEEMRHFIAVARSEAAPVCTLEDGIDALALALQTLSFDKSERKAE